ncbi:MAG: PadR family transcriptional regulator [Anaerolineae bacterium]|nr:PadR family transcriptional regulator [Anaerolineae bacterium]
MSHRYLILGLLAEQPMTGYDIRKQVKEVLSTATNASYGTLYPTLHKLLQEDAVQVDEIDQEGRPTKKVYRITTHGQAELRQWLREPTSADRIKRDFLLKLYFAQQVSQSDLQRLLAERRDETEALLDTLQSQGESLDDPREKWIIDYALMLYRAEMAWLDRVENQIASA